MIIREIIDIVAGYSKFADTLHETLPQNISSIFAMPGKLMDLRTRQLFRILIPFLNVSNDNGTFPAIPADALPDVPVLSQYHLTGSFRLFQKEHPEISLALTEVEESELMEGIEKKRFAMILARESMIDTEHYHFFPIATDRICVMLPADHPLATRQKLSVTALTDQSFLLMHPYTSIYQLCMQIFQNAGIHPSILRTARVESLISAVAVGEGISLFAESNFRLFQHEGVISVPLEESPVLRIGFAYKKAGEYTPAMDCFLHFMADSQKY